MALFYYKEKKNKGIRAAAYLRLSIEDGDKAESNSIGNQRELIQNFVAERPELHLVGEYADDGYTGTNFERPGFTQMMEDIQSDKINCIIVKDLSRLGRNYIEMGKYLERIFPMMGIRFIAINDNYDNANTESSDSDSIVVPFKNLLNDSYCRDISIKVRSQLDIKRRKGEFIGGYAVYGYSKDEQNKNRLVVDEYAADIVRSIYRRKLEGMSANSIADQLNSEGVLAPSEYKRLCGLNYHSGFKTGTHAKWQAIQVLRILKNEVYTGTMVQGKRQKINYKIKKIRDVDESCWIKVPNTHEAIISQRMFDIVQEVLKLDTCASKGQKIVHLFSGIVRCGDCGQNMVRCTVSKKGKKYIYLNCVTNHKGLGCSSHHIRESKLEEVVLAALQEKIQQISGLEERLDEINNFPMPLSWGRNLQQGHPSGDFINRYAHQCPLKNQLYIKSRFRVNLISFCHRIPNISKRSITSDCIAGFFFTLQGTPHLFGNVFRIHGVDHIPNRKSHAFHILFARTIKIIVDSNQSNTKKRKYSFNIVPRFQIVATKAREVFYNDTLDLLLPHIVHQTGKGRALKICSCKAIVKISIHIIQFTAAVNKILHQCNLRFHAFVIFVIFHRKPSIDCGWYFSFIQFRELH